MLLLLAFALLTVAAPLETRDTSSCVGQSCFIAAFSGSSGVIRGFNDTIVFQTVAGQCCVIDYNPLQKPLAVYLNPELATACSSVIIPRESPLGTAPAKACAKKIHLFARGTQEGGVLGGVGDALKSALGSGWDVQGIPYDASLEGGMCLGLPGAGRARQQIERMVAACPNSIITAGGFSQGAMVIRNALASSRVANRVKGIATFGDPMNGAPIKSYAGKVHIACHSSDYVCAGLPFINEYHTSYSDSIAGAAQFLKSL